MRVRRLYTGDTGLADDHMLYFNRSPKLPPNRCVAHVIGLSPRAVENQTPRRLFWRGDVVVMRFRLEDDSSSDPSSAHYIDCLDAHIAVTGRIEDWFREAYRRGTLERAFALEVEQCKRTLCFIAPRYTPNRSFRETPQLSLEPICIRECHEKLLIFGKVLEEQGRFGFPRFNYRTF
jgi:hypothetical protein